MTAAIMTVLSCWVIGELLPEWRSAVWIALAVVFASRVAEHCL